MSAASRPVRVRILRLVGGVMALATTAIAAEDVRHLDAEVLRDRIHGYWIGQLAGNYLGFPFENLYNDEPLPVLIDRYHDFRDIESTGLRMNRDDRRAYIHIMADALGGAWSDDDTDFELVTLHAVERHGLTYNYAQVTEMWRRHVNRFIWSASRIARDLMDKGHVPPATGSRALNPHWFSLSSQLKNEIWAVFYAGMPAPAVSRVTWDAHTMNDDWAVHPDIVYGAMISAAFFESDPRRLVEFAMSFLPPDSPHLRGIRDLLRWRDEGLDWREARARLYASYYREIDGFVVPVPYLGAIINGLCGVMAVLWGEGDFTRTVGIATSAGFDCDNQAATCGGLIGVMHGAGAIPPRFTLEMPSRGRWTKPFNNTYINYSRDELPAYFRIDDLVDRILAITEKAILDQGGEKLTVDGRVVYAIPSNRPPLQLEATSSTDYSPQETPRDDAPAKLIDQP